MRPRGLGILFFVLVIGVTALPGTLVRAQSGTPAADSQEAAPCIGIEPRDADDLRALSATPGSTSSEETQVPGAAAATPTPFALPEGEAADETVVAEVTTLYQQLIACLNAGEYLRAYALYTDEYLVQNLSDEILTNLAATPVSGENLPQSSFGGVRDVRVLADERIGALVTTRAEGSGELLLFAVLRRDGDRLRIDEEQVVEVGELPGTPVGSAG